MKDLKKIACVALSGAMIVSLAACGSSSKKASVDELTIDQVADAFEGAGFEKLTWDEYWWDANTFYVSDDETKAGATGADESSNYELEIYDSAEDAQAAYESDTGYIISMAEAYDIDIDNVSEDDYAYLMATEEGEAIGYFWAGTSVFQVDADDIDEANDILDALGYPTF